MTIPSDATKANCDSTVDDPKQALTVDLAGVIDTLNLLLAHLRANGVTIGASNVFTADQTIQSSDAGATVAPTLALDRNSASPAASDQLGYLRFLGRDDAGSSTEYAAIWAEIVDPAAATKLGRVTFQTQEAGTNTARFRLGKGLFSATGGLVDKGAGTINAPLYHNGTKVTALNGMAQGWIKYTGAGVASAAFNATVSRSSTGVSTVTWTTPFASADYAVMVMVQATAASNAGIVQVSTGGQVATSVTIQTYNASSVLTDFDSVYVVAFGAQ